MSESDHQVFGCVQRHPIAPPTRGRMSIAAVVGEVDGTAAGGCLTGFFQSLTHDGMPHSTADLSSDAAIRPAWRVAASSPFST